MRAVVVLPLVPVIAAIGIRLGLPGGNSMSITGPATSRARPSLGATCMRKPGRGVDLADRAADVLVRLGDVGREEVDAADVEADRLDGAHGHLDVVGVHEVGHVGRGAAGREVAGRAEEDALAGGRHACRGV